MPLKPAALAAAPAASTAPAAAATAPVASVYERNAALVREVAKVLTTKHGWEAMGSPVASQGQTLHHTGMHRGAAKSGIRRKLYGGTTHEVGRRSFVGQTRRQRLRWLSTLTYSYLLACGTKPQNIVEVQAAFDPDAKDIWVSTNNSATNSLLAQKATSTPKEFIELMLATVKDTPASSNARTNPSVRWRHITALETWVVKGESLLATSLTKGRIRVPGTPDDAKATEGLHAERRIREALGRSIRVADIGGLRRPCLFCYLHLFASPEPDDVSVHSGPGWTSGAASILEWDMLQGQLDLAKGATAEEFADAIAEAVAGTYAGKAASKKKAPTLDVDTDSDGAAENSDMEDDDEAAKRAPVPDASMDPDPPSAAAAAPVGLAAASVASAASATVGSKRRAAAALVRDGEDSDDEASDDEAAAAEEARRKRHKPIPKTPPATGTRRG